jgi:hypothetical protein
MRFSWHCWFLQLSLHANTEPQPGECSHHERGVEHHYETAEKYREEDRHRQASANSASVGYR